jgi:transcriptional regulator with XRE-family HTH domain
VTERHDFAAFLRARRERVTPAEVGLPSGGRRRTPGLRREELAMLAGISVDYLVRLEQGRETSPSVGVVRSLASVLGLDGDETKHIWSLVARNEDPGMCPLAALADEPVDATTRALLDRMGATPAFVLGELTEVMAWNDAYERVMAATGVLDERPPNLVRYTFTDPRARRLYRDWDDIAREQVGNLRRFVSDLPDALAGRGRELVADLSARSPEFAALWGAFDVGEKRRGVKHLDHPVAGPLDLEFTALGLPDGIYRRLVAYVPADEASAAALDRLVAAPRLRAVGDTGG